MTQKYDSCIAILDDEAFHLITQNYAMSFLQREVRNKCVCYQHTQYPVPTHNSTYLH